MDPRWSQGTEVSLESEAEALLVAAELQAAILEKEGEPVAAGEMRVEVEELQLPPDLAVQAAA